MKLLEIQIEDFMSIQNVSITFEDGIISVIGKNNDVIGATSNGSGKSALFDAIVWGLYGKTIRPVGSDDVIRRGRDKASVSLYFQKGESTYGITRARGEKPSLEINVHANDGREPQDLSQGTPSLTQGKLDEIIGMDYKTFLSVATFDLDALRFARATDKEQKEILERLLNLDVYNLALEKTRKELATKEKELTSVESIKHYTEQTGKELLKENDNNNIAWQKHEVDLKVKRDQDAKRFQELNRLIAEAQLAIEEYNKLIKAAQTSAINVDNDKINQWKLEIDGYNGSICALETKMHELQRTSIDYQIDPQLIQKMNDAKSALTKLDTELKMVERTRKLKESQIEFAEKRLGQPCKECNRPITETELGGVIENYALEVIGLLEQEAGIKSEYVNREIDHNNYHMAYTVEYQKQIDAMNSRSKLNTEIGNCNKAISTNRSLIREIECSIRDEENRARKDIQVEVAAKQGFVNLFNKNIVAYNDEIVRIKHAFDLMAAKSVQYKQMGEIICQKMVDNDSKLEQETKKHAFISENIAYLKYWEKAFSYQGIRAVLLDDVAAKLTENANNYLKEIIGGSLWVNISTQSTNKDGERKERMEVQVFNSFGAGTYYGCSKGEMQRIDIAISLAIHDIAKTRSKNPITFTIFDEVMERLDEAGCDAIIRLLHKERAHFGMVFIVTHNPNLAIRFPKKIEFVKQNGITSLVNNEHVNIVKEAAVVAEAPKKRGRPKKVVNT